MLVHVTLKEDNTFSLQNSYSFVYNCDRVYRAIETIENKKYLKPHEIIPDISSETTTMTIPTTTVNSKLTHIFGTRGAEIFMIILVLLFGLGLIAMEIKYVQLRNKLKEYKLHGGETGNPAYDNPVFNGSHRSPERYIKSGSIPLYVRNSNSNIAQ